MSRKDVTQIFPWLLPVRRKQRKMFLHTPLTVVEQHGHAKRISQNHQVMHCLVWMQQF